MPKKSAGPKATPVPQTLIQAVGAIDADALRRMLEAGARPDEHDTEWGEPLLSYAVTSIGDHPGALEIVRLLIAHGADVNRDAGMYGRPIFFAAYSGHEDIVRELLARGARTDGTSQADKHTLLHCACAGGLSWLVEQCLSAGMDPNALSEQGHTPLQYAVVMDAGGEKKPVKDMLAMVERLLAAGADVHYDNPGWGTALHWAASHEAPDAITLLLDRGAQIDAATSTAGEQPIHKAARSGAEASVALLLSRGADASARDASGWTPLHFAALGESAGVVALLRNAGARADVPSTGARRVGSETYAAKKTPLDIAKRKRRNDIIAALA